MCGAVKDNGVGGGGDYDCQTTQLGVSRSLGRGLPLPHLPLPPCWAPSSGSDYHGRRASVRLIRRHVISSHGSYSALLALLCLLNGTCSSCTSPCLPNQEETISSCPCSCSCPRSLFCCVGGFCSWKSIYPDSKESAISLSHSRSSAQLLDFDWSCHNE